MPYCPHCAVELEAGLATCPLCGEVPQQTPPVAPPSYPERDLGPDPAMSSSWPQVRRRIFFGASALIVVGIASSLIVDLNQSLALNWAMTVVVSCLAGWFLLGLLLYQWDRPLYLLVRILVLAALTVWLLDLCDGAVTWSLGLALPIVGLVALIFTPLFLAVFHFRISWASTAAWTLFCGALFCLGLEAWVDFRTQSEIRLTWSIPVMLATFPAALSMFFVRYHLMRVVNFEKVFHR